MAVVVVVILMLGVLSLGGQERQGSGRYTWPVIYRRRQHESMVSRPRN